MAWPTATPAADLWRLCGCGCTRLGMQTQPRVLARNKLVPRELQPEHRVHLVIILINRTAPAIRLPVSRDGEAGVVTCCNRAHTHTLQPRDQKRRELLCSVPVAELAILRSAKGIDVALAQRQRVVVAYLHR